MRVLAPLDTLIGVSPGDESILAGETLRNAGRPGGVAEFQASRPPLAEAAGIARAILVAAETRARIHIRQTNSARGITTWRRLRDMADASIETTPQCLLFASASYGTLGANLKASPPLREEEALETAAIQSLAGSFAIERWRKRPFRSPHHTSSGVALVGGGQVPRPGEISLAHHGVLFLDELPEFDRKVLEVLREPLETGAITISRAARQADFPASFQLIAAMNPCPCGWLGHPSSKCRRTPDAVQRYQDRISGPLLDRIDIQVPVAAMTPDTMAQLADGEPSAAIAARVTQAHARQLARQGKANQKLTTREIDQHCHLDAAAERLLGDAMQHLHWSARAYHRVLKVARTIADLAGVDTVNAQHVAEAIQYRRGLCDH